MIASVNEVQFELHVVGSSTNKTWKGTFKAKARLSLRDRVTKDQLRREMLGANPLDAGMEATNIATILSELNVRLISSPEWWAELKYGADLEDENVLMEVFEKTMKVQTNAEDSLKKSAEGVEKEVKTIPDLPSKE